MNAITDTQHAASARSIGAILIDSGRLTPKAVGRILDIHKEQGLRFGDAAIQPGLLTEEDIQRALSQQYSYTYLIQAAMVAKIYKQNLSRVYRNAEGDRIMLSVVYGSDQLVGCRDFPRSGAGLQLEGGNLLGQFQHHRVFVVDGGHILAQGNKVRLLPDHRHCVLLGFRPDPGQCLKLCLHGCGRSRDVRTDNLAARSQPLQQTAERLP